MRQAPLNTAVKADVLRLTKRKALTAGRMIIKGLYGICRQSDVTWRYIANLRSWLAYQRN